MTCNRFVDDILGNFGGNRACTARDAQFRNMVGFVYESIVGLNRRSED